MWPKGRSIDLSPRFDKITLANAEHDFLDFDFDGVQDWDLQSKVIAPIYQTQAYPSSE